MVGKTASGRSMFSSPSFTGEIKKKIGKERKGNLKVHYHRSLPLMAPASFSGLIVLLWEQRLFVLSQ